MTDEELVKRLRLLNEVDAAVAADRIENLIKLVKDAFDEGFGEGYGGGWLWGDPSPAWRKSDTLAELERK